MGTDDSPNQKPKNIDINYKKYNSGEIIEQNQINQFGERKKNDPQQEPNDVEKLQPIRRHSNIRDSNYFQNFLNSKDLSNLHNSVSTFSGKTNNNSELPSLVERSKSRKYSQQYCADFKKSYMEGTNKNTFLNHLADSLNHGTIIPKEEIEKFREEYIPKYFFDMRNIEDPRTGIKYWKNFGKFYPDEKFHLYIKKLGTNPVGASELFYVKRCWFYHYLMNNYARSKKENPIIFTAVRILVAVCKSYWICKNRECRRCKKL